MFLALEVCSLSYRGSLTGLHRLSLVSRCVPLRGQSTLTSPAYLRTRVERMAGTNGSVLSWPPIVLDPH
ncbi:hypothetical protein BC827DRAFT_1210805 [Russula dissimulans]|nr:hypothetical protein BC827DRAFT_1210805 [Russula dissimulans]